jgi:hypothetical protein
MKGRFIQVAAPKKKSIVSMIANKQFGDAVEVIAQPIAKTLDKVLKTNISGCGGCKQRKERWNLPQSNP